MDTIEQMATFGLEPQWMQEIDTSGGVSGGRPLATAAWRMAVQIAIDVDDRMAEIKRNPDPDLSEAGEAKLLARTVKDARVKLAQVHRHADTLKREVMAWWDNYKPAGGEPDNTVSAAIWSILPTDALETDLAYQDAVDRADWLTCNAIETMPGVFKGVLPRAKIIKLRRTRIEAENPQRFAALVASEEALTAAGIAAAAADIRLDSLARGLPNPDPETGATVGADGLLVLSPSQASEAMGAA